MDRCRRRGLYGYKHRFRSVLDPDECQDQSERGNIYGIPQVDAGDPGRIAITYLGSENSSELNQSNIDGEPWDGNAHYANSNVSYYLYVTYSLNALDPNPVFHTVRASADPVQIGSICLNSGDCRDIGGSNRNLLDFNDLHIDREGRCISRSLTVASVNARLETTRGLRIQKQTWDTLLPRKWTEPIGGIRHTISIRIPVTLLTSCE